MFADRLPPAAVGIPADGQTDRSLQLARGLLDASEGSTCAIDSGSRIVAVNKAWTAFAAHNGGSDELCGVGVSYLGMCDRTAAHGWHRRP